MLRLILTRRISLSRCHMSFPFCCYIWKFKWAIFKKYKPWILAGIRTAYLPPPRPLFAPDTREGLSSRHDRWRRLSVCFVAFSLTVERSVFNIIELQVLSFDNSTRDLRRTTNPVRWVFFTYNVMFINYYIILDFDVVILIWSTETHVKLWSHNWTTGIWNRYTCYTKDKNKFSWLFALDNGSRGRLCWSAHSPTKNGKFCILDSMY